MSKDFQSYYAINKNNPIIKKFINNSKDNLDLLKLIENTLPYQEIFRLMSDGKEMMITWEDNEDESIKLIKKYILDLKESNIEKLIIVGLVQKFLQNSVLSLTTEQIIEMLWIKKIYLAIKNVQSFILQNHRDLSGGEKLTKIVIERIEKSEEYFQDIATDEQREFIIKKFSQIWVEQWRMG